MVQVGYIATGERKMISLQVHGLLRSQKTFPSCSVVKRGYSGIVVVDKPTLAIQQLCRARVTGMCVIPNHYCYFSIPCCRYCTV